jgi:mannosylfructose-phosphate synthase
MTVLTHARRIMMISTHGYVSAGPVLGRPDTGGQVVYVLELSKSLSELGYAVDIFTRRFENQPTVERVNDQVRIVRIPCGSDDFIPKEVLCEHIPEWAERAADAIRRRGLKYELIDSHYWDAGLAGVALADELQIPHVHTPHSLGVWKRDGMANQADADELERRYNFARRIQDETAIYDDCDVLIATTPQQHEILTANEYDVSPEKIEVLPPGYSPSRFHPISETGRRGLKKSLGLEGKVILALGRLARNKGYDLLLRAMPYVFVRHSDARLLLAAGSQRLSDNEQNQLTSLRELARDLGIADRVLFRDYVPDAELPDIYRAADVFALSSRYEPFGMTAIEAMACGTPTIVTTEGGLWEHVTWGLEAIYANPCDPEAFGHALSQVLLYPRLSRQLSQAGSRKVRECYTWPNIARRLLTALYGDEQPATILLRDRVYSEVRHEAEGPAPRAVASGR